MTDKEKVQQVINDYATYADTRQTQKQFELFASDGSMTVYYPWNDPDKPDLVDTPEKLMATFEALKQYEHTFHMIGQSSVTVDGDTAEAYVYTIAHHVTANEDGTKSLMVAYLRYNDKFGKQADGSWLFTNRELHADFIENRPLN